MTRRPFGHTVLSIALSITAAGLWATPTAADGQKPPNVVLIMTDDMGVECIGAHGGTSYKTPHLDRLAAGGMRFDRCHVQPLCTPTRVQLMTGLYNVRNYVRFGHIDPSQTTFAQLFRKAGYATGIAGKWQLGHEVDLPKKLGFDESCLWQHTRRPPRYANPGLEYNGVEKNFTNGEYGPDLVNAFALDFIARHKDRPFLLYYPMILTHDPYQPTPDSPDWDPLAKGEQVNRNAKHFGEMVTYADKLVGKIVAALHQHGLAEKTLVIFIGDNGTGKGVTSRMGDHRIAGGKGGTLLTGTHVPCIVSWPGTIKPGGVCDDLIDSTDFLPTICAAAGVPMEGLQLDGVSFLPQLRGEKGQPRQWMYCWYARNGGAKADREFAMDKQYKLYRGGEFYDLSRDPEEKEPVDAATLSGPAAAARRQLAAVLDQFKDARPASLMKKAAAETAKSKD
jgi:arylsulfatase A